MLLESFVGEDRYQRVKLIRYFDKLFEMELKQFVGRSELEERVLFEIKKLEKIASKYMKVFNMPDNEAPNILKYKSKSALLFHHYRWVHDEMTFTNFKEIALVNF